MMTSEEAMKLVRKYGSAAKASLATGIPRSTLGDWIRKKSHKKVSEVENKKAQTIAEFRNLHDKSVVQPKAIRSTLKYMGKGWMYERDFIGRTGLRPADITPYRDIFADHIIRLPDGRRIWVGKVSVANKLRDMI